jgi:hypothetical protein
MPIKNIEVKSQQQKKRRERRREQKQQKQMAEQDFQLEEYEDGDDERDGI